MSNGKTGDDLEGGGEIARDDQQTKKEKQVIVTSPDVSDAHDQELTKCVGRRMRRSGSRRRRFDLDDDIVVIGAEQSFGERLPLGILQGQQLAMARLQECQPLGPNHEVRKRRGRQADEDAGVVVLIELATRRCNRGGLLVEIHFQGGLSCFG